MEPVTTNNTLNKEIICQDRSFLPPYPLSVVRERHHSQKQALPEYQDGRKYRLVCLATVSVASNDERSISQGSGCQTFAGRSVTRVSGCQTIAGEALPECQDGRQSLEKRYHSISLSDFRRRSTTRVSACQAVAGRSTTRGPGALSGGRLKPLTMFEALFRSKRDASTRARRLDQS